MGQHAYPPIESKIDAMLRQLEERKGIKGDMRNIPQDTIKGGIADFLYGGRNKLNETFGIPFVETGLGLGDMLMGESPEYMEELSHGAPVWKGKGFGGRLDTRMGDVLGLPLPYAGGAQLAKLGLKGIGKGLQKMNPSANTSKTVVDPSRRKFNKMSLGTAAAAIVSPKIVKGLMDFVPDTATAVKTAAKAIPKITSASAANIKMAKLFGHLSGILNVTPKSLAKTFKDEGIDGITRTLNKADTPLEFPDIGDVDIDSNKILQLLDENPKGNFGSLARSPRPMSVKETKTITEDIVSGIDDIGKHPTYDPRWSFDKMIGDLLEQEYDTRDLFKIINENIDLDSVPKKLRDHIQSKMDDLPRYINDLDTTNFQNSFPLPDPDALIELEAFYLRPGA